MSVGYVGVMRPFSVAKYFIGGLKTIQTRTATTTINPVEVAQLHIATARQR
ncbi:hypothetical protein D3C75_1230840 [compost metagenome]